MTEPVSETPFKLLQLPQELRNSIYSHLDNGDAKSLRATCSAMGRDVPLRLTRVFLSANSLNIDVFRAVANHEEFRHSVTEIVWDDSRLYTRPDLEGGWSGSYYTWPEPDEPATCPLWFQRRSMNTWYSDPRLSLGWQESWDLYKSLIQDQEQIIASNVDIDTFKFGLESFPALKRVTITPSAHGMDHKPLYRTPMIRSFPPGFEYPRPNAWPASTRHDPLDALPWISDGPPGSYERMYGVRSSFEEYRNRWRGYRAVTRALAENEHHLVTELVVGDSEVGCGMNCHIFDQPCTEYNDLVTLLQRPGFSHLSLDIFTGFLEHEDWISYKSGFLHDALAKAKDLKYISLRTTTDIADGEPGQLHPEDVEKVDLSLSTIFPIHQWSQLEHFGLSGFILDLNDLIGVLAALPTSLRSVELSQLAFKGKEDVYENLLVKMRDTLDWSSRPEQERPKVHIIASANPSYREDQFVEVDDAVYSFLYQGGENPFQGNGSIIYEGRGGIRRDIFDPEFMAPY